MKPTFKTVVLLFSFFATQHSFSQDCGCTINEVETNTVESCDLVIGTIVTVNSAATFREAIIDANNSGGNMTILIEDGTYEVASATSYPYITASNLVIRSLSGNRDAVVLTGGGMQSVSPSVENVMYIVGDNVTIADLTVKEVGNHGIAGHGDSMFVHNVKFQDTYEQMFKINSAGDGAVNGKIQCSLFEYTAGVGPQFYIGGVDMHSVTNWNVNDNVFKNIISPSQAVSEHAVHIWNNSANNVVERNVIINCDRGIGFGLGNSANSGGIIRNNMIYNDGSGLFSDVGIGLETSPNTKVYNNTIYITYPNAIEYRFEATTGVTITNNLTNKLIKSRNGGQATLTTNYTEAQSSWFINPSLGNLRLHTNEPLVVDQGSTLSEVSVDIDQVSRVDTDVFDLGAQEYSQSVILSTAIPGDPNNRIIAFPNPMISSLKLYGDQSNVRIKVYNILGDEITSFKNVSLQSGFTINTDSWQSGIYQCQVIDSNNSEQVIRIIKSK